MYRSIKERQEYTTFHSRRDKHNERSSTNEKNTNEKNTNEKNTMNISNDGVCGTNGTKGTKRCNNINITQNLLDDIEILTKRLHNAEMVNLVLKKELSDIRRKLRLNTKEDVQVDTKVIQHVIGRRKKKLAAETHQRKQTSPSTDIDKTLEKFTDKNIDENTFQEGERKRRAPNIIVHGLHEEPNKSEDKAAKRFLKSLDMDINPKLAARLGNKTENYHEQRLSLIHI